MLGELRERSPRLLGSRKQATQPFARNRKTAMLNSGKFFVVIKNQVPASDCSNVGMIQDGNPSVWAF